RRLLAVVVRLSHLVLLDPAADRCGAGGHSDDVLWRIFSGRRNKPFSYLYRLRFGNGSRRIPRAVVGAAVVHSPVVRPHYRSSSLPVADGDDPDCGDLVRHRRNVEILPHLLGYLLHHRRQYDRRRVARAGDPRARSAMPWRLAGPDIHTDTHSDHSSCDYYGDAPGDGVVVYEHHPCRDARRRFRHRLPAAGVGFARADRSNL